MSSERALDELFFLRDQFKAVQDERRRDVEETAEFIKGLINSGKQETSKELGRLGGEVERVRKEVAEKASV